MECGPWITFLYPNPDLMKSETLRWTPAMCGLTSPGGDPDTCSNLRTPALDRNPKCISVKPYYRLDSETVID